MGVGSGLYVYDVVVKRSRSLSHLLMSSFIIIQSSPAFLCTCPDDHSLFSSTQSQYPQFLIITAYCTQALH